MAQEYWPRSLRFLTTDLAIAAFTASNEEIALLAAGITPKNSASRMSCFGFSPHGAARAVADFVLVRTRQEREVSGRHGPPRCSLSSCRSYRPDLVIVNPMGIQVTYLETDRTLITETP